MPQRRFQAPHLLGRLCVAESLCCLPLFSQSAKPVLQAALNDGAPCANAARL